MGERIRRINARDHRKLAIDREQLSPPRMPKESDSDLAVRYPNLNAWVFGGGWIVIGQDHGGGSFARALDEGGQAWEGKRNYRRLEEVLKAIDQGIADWLKENG